MNNVTFVKVKASAYSVTKQIPMAYVYELLLQLL